MIWESVPLMTIVDLLVIGSVLFALAGFIRYRKALIYPGTMYGLVVVTAGLSVVGLFYLYDLVTMYVFPLFMAEKAAMAMMADLHLNYSWIAALLGVGTVAIGFLIVVRGIFEMTQRLKENEHKFHGAFDNMGVGVRVRTMDNKVNMVNQALCDIMGYSEDELLALNFRDINHPDDVDNSLEQAERLKAGEIDGYQNEKRYIRKDGQVIWCANSISVARDEAGEIVFRVVIFKDITERKRVEHALQSSEERFRRAFENSGVGMTIRNCRDRSIIINHAFQNMLGYTQNELQHIYLSDLVHPEHREEHQELRRKLLDGDEDHIQVTSHYIRKDGKTVWLTNESSSVRNADGSLELTIRLFQDITDRKLAEEKAAEKSHLLEATFENMSQGIAVYDSEQTLAAFNPQYAEMLGLPLDYLYVGMDREDILRAQAPQRGWDASEVDAMIEEILGRAKDEGRSNEHTLPNGRSYLYERTPMPNGGYLLTLTDITDRKKQEERFRTLVEYAPEAITIIDVDSGLYVNVNPSAEDLHCLPRDALVGKKGPADLSPEIQPDGRPSSEAALDYLRRAMAGEFPKFDWIHLTPDGEETLCEVSLARLPDLHSNLVRASISNITERKAMENQLHQAQKMEAVGQLTGGIAHDFNNLLAISLGNVELAERVAEEGGDVQPFLTIVKRASERGASLTHKLLAFSRKQALFPAVIDAAELIGEMTDLLRRSLGETIEVRVTGDDDLWLCEVDPALLESAVLNLAINARDAMPDGGTLAIQTANASLNDDYAAAQVDVEPGDYVLVAVTDTGTGMPKNVIDQVFDPFFTTKEVGEGSGLGLSMVYGFVKQSKGHVTIYSEEGEGTTIKLYLPRSDKTEQQLEEKDREEIPEARGETVLVVEDDPDVRTLSVALLSGLGYEILEAPNGKIALKIFESAPRVDLLFTDVVLPGGISGPQLAAKVRNRSPGIAVLYASGYAELANFDDSTFGDKFDLLQKPYRLADLARKVRAALDNPTL